jgi:hypothetical protein
VNPTTSFVWAKTANERKMMKKEERAYGLGVKMVKYGRIIWRIM